MPKTNVHNEKTHPLVDLPRAGPGPASDVTVRWGLIEAIQRRTPTSTFLLMRSGRQIAVDLELDDVRTLLLERYDQLARTKAIKLFS